MKLITDKFKNEVMLLIQDGNIDALKKIIVNSEYSITQPFMISLCQEASVYDQFPIVDFLLNDKSLKYNAYITESSYYPLTACAINGDTELLNYFLNQKILLKNNVRIKPEIKIFHDDLLKTACYYGSMDFIRMLLTAPGFKEYANINSNNGDALQKACFTESRELIEYLLSAPELDVHADININNDVAFSLACKKNDLNLIKYLLASPQLKKHANIHAENDMGLSWLFFYSQSNIDKLDNTLDIIDYLLASSELKEHIDIHGSNDAFFKSILFNKDVMKHVILVHDLEKTQTIENLLKETEESNKEYSDYANQLFELKDFNKKLEGSLVNKDKTRKTKL